jgi:hypothetical protein
MYSCWMLQARCADRGVKHWITEHHYNAEWALHAIQKSSRASLTWKTGARARRNWSGGRAHFA